MSDEKVKATGERKKLEIVLDEYAPFPSIAGTAYVTSAELCKLVYEVFKATFEDFEGCLFEVGNTGEPTLALLFNHGQYDQDATVACERAGGKQVGNGVLDRTRRRDFQMTEGDRYVLTQDGRDVVSTLLVPRIFNNGNIDWRRIVSEWSDRSGLNMYTPTMQIPQYTKVSFIDLRRVCGLVYGQKTEDGDNIEYDVRVAAPMTPTGFQQQAAYNINMNYMLSITSVSCSELAKVYEKLGYGSSSRIIRG